MPSNSVCPECTCGRQEQEPAKHAPQCPIRREWDQEQQEKQGDE